jgi:hypothetical protein
MELEGKLREKKREGKKDGTAEYYFNEDRSDPPNLEPPLTSPENVYPSVSNPESRLLNLPPNCIARKQNEHGVTVWNQVEVHWSMRVYEDTSKPNHRNQFFHLRDCIAKYFDYDFPEIIISNRYAEWWMHHYQTSPNYKRLYAFAKQKSYRLTYMRNWGARKRFMDHVRDATIAEVHLERYREQKRK